MEPKSDDTFIAYDSPDFQTVTLKFRDGTVKTMSSCEYDRLYRVQGPDLEVFGEQLMLF